MKVKTVLAYYVTSRMWKTSRFLLLNICAVRNVKQLLPILLHSIHKVFLTPPRHTERTDSFHVLFASERTSDRSGFVQLSALGRNAAFAHGRARFIVMVPAGMIVMMKMVEVIISPSHFGSGTKNVRLSAGLHPCVRSQSAATTATSSATSTTTAATPVAVSFFRLAPTGTPGLQPS